MNEWNELLAVLDRTIGFPNKLSSKVKKVRQAYDNKKNEHVIWLEYRVRVNPGDHKTRTTLVPTACLMRSPGRQSAPGC